MSNSTSHNETSTPTPSLDLNEGYWEALLDEEQHQASKLGHRTNGNGFHEAPVSASGDDSTAAHPIVEADWGLATTTRNNDQVVELQVVGYNRGGLLVKWNSIHGFVPASQLLYFPAERDEATRREILSKRVGENLRLRIIEMETSNRRLILSERAAEVESGQRNLVLQTLESGSTHSGTITNLCDFGAFVDLGGIEGLIHISEISWGRVNHPRDYLSLGQKVTVYIMGVDQKTERIALSIKRLQPDPWKSVETQYQVGQIITVTISHVVDFGAFATVEKGLEGLIHISELAEGQFLHPNNVIQEGDSVSARILTIDGQARRMGLSLRNLTDT